MRRVFLIAAMLCALTQLVFAQGDEKQYIVEFTEEIDLLDYDRSGQLTVLGESELLDAINAGVVEFYEEDYEVELLGTSGKKWDLELIDAGEAKRIGCEGQGVNIGIIDSGVYMHPDLTHCIKGGYNFLEKTTDVTDNIGHGTFVSGLIAANVNSANDIVGIASDANLIPLKCFDNGYTTTVSVIYDAIYAAVDIYDCDIINMSLGLTAQSVKLKEAIDYATGNGVIVIAATGNKGGEALYYPAAYEKVIGVGSVDENSEISSFSQHNSSVFVVAPGENVWSTYLNGTYSQKNGTSFSTPLVAGMVAVMLNIKEDASYDEIAGYLKETSVDLGDTGYDTYFGHGLVNVKACIQKMLEGKRFFISPIECDGTSSVAVVLNNSEASFDGYCMWGEYSGRRMLDMAWSNVSVAPGDVFTVKCNLVSNTVRCFLWKSLNDISAISNVRESGGK